MCQRRGRDKKPDSVFVRCGWPIRTRTETKNIRHSENRPVSSLTSDLGVVTVDAMKPDRALREGDLDVFSSERGLDAASEFARCLPLFGRLPAFQPVVEAAQDEATVLFVARR
jgi:hypothetical protein